jgi:hypothetical protein
MRPDFDDVSTRDPSVAGEAALATITYGGVLYAVHVAFMPAILRP